MRRPYKLPDLSPSKGGQVADAEAEFRRIVCFLQAPSNALKCLENALTSP